MRAFLIVFGTIVLVGLAVLLVWRPAVALGLAVLGAAIHVARMKRAARPRPARSESAEPAPDARRARVEAALAPATPAVDHPLAARLAASGWMAEPAASGPAWLVAVRADVRVAFKTAPDGPRATADEITEAVAAKGLERAHYAAIICAQRPADTVMAAAKMARVHIVNLARLEAYLALAGAFKAAAPSDDARVHA